MHHPTDISRTLLDQSCSTDWIEKLLNGSTTKDRSDDPSYHESIFQNTVQKLKPEDLLLENTNYFN